MNRAVLIISILICAYQLRAGEIYSKAIDPLGWSSKLHRVYFTDALNKISIYDLKTNTYKVSPSQQDLYDMVPGGNETVTDAWNKTLSKLTELDVASVEKRGIRTDCKLSQKKSPWMANCKVLMNGKDVWHKTDSDSLGITKTKAYALPEPKDPIFVIVSFKDSVYKYIYYDDLVNIPNAKKSNITLDTFLKELPAPVRTLFQTSKETPFKSQ